MIPLFQPSNFAARCVSCCILSLVLTACGGTGGGSSRAAATSVNLSATASPVVEGNVGSKQVSVTVSLSAEAATSVTVDYATQDDGAIAGTDYTATSGTLTFAQGVLSAEVLITILADEEDEGSEESFRLMFSNPTDGVVLASSEIEIVITDDDGAANGGGNPQISVADASAPEASGKVDFTALLDGLSSSDVTLDYSAVASSATANEDFVPSSGTVTIPAGQSSATFSIVTNNDNVDEEDETFSLSLSNATGATLTTPNVQGVIEDDDGAPEISIADVSITEGDAGSTLAELTIQLSGASERAVQLDYATSSINATAGTDYQAISGTLVIPAGTTSENLSIEILGDTEEETSEGLFVEFSNVQNGSLTNATSNITIVDDDVVGVTLANLSIANATLSEDGQSDLQVTLSSAISSDVVVNYSVLEQSASAADLSSTSGSVTISAGATSAALPISAVDDNIDEPQESFVVSINTNNADTTVTNPNGTVRLNDNDARPAISLANLTTSESNTGTTTATVQVTLSHPSSQPVTFNAATINGSAMAGSDYVTTTGSRTIPALSTTIGIDVDIVGDTLFEENETFALRVSNPTNAIIGSSSSTITISDNDTQTQSTFSVADTSASESTGQMQFTVSLSGATGSTATVNYALSNGTASAGSDFTDSSGTLNFPVGTTSIPVLVSISNDSIEEPNESFNLILSNPSPSNVSIADGTATATILDDDDPVITPTLSIADASITEGNSGSQNLQFTVSLSSASSSDVTVSYSTANGTATANSDFTSRSGTVTFGAGVLSQSISVPILGDTVSEGAEQFSLNLSGPSGATLADATAIGSIQDNDGASSLAVAGGSRNEGTGSNTAFNFVVTLAPTSSSTVSVAYATQAGTASSGSDFIATSGTLTFAAGESSKSISVQIVADSVDEANEAFSVTLSSPTNATVGVSSATLTIIDDDVAGPGPVGLSSRPSNTSCVAPAEIPGGGGSLSIVKAFPNLPDDFAQTIGIRQSANDSSKFFVLQRLGAIRRFDNTQSVSSAPLYLQINNLYGGNEGGLLGLAFHPNWPNVKELFVSYTSGTNDANMVSRISRLVISNDSSLPATFTEQILLTVDQFNSNHNGGDLHFGSDGYLYAAFGDGGNSGDPSGHGQNNTRLLSSMIRIDVVGVNFPSPGYNIPGNNPFAGNSKCGPAANASNCPEIYAWGFRNPWRFSFDTSTNRLWLADVGQFLYEEVNVVTRSGNYGWRCREGAHDFNTSGCGGGLTDPVHEYAHSNGNLSVTGGYVYRGSDAPSLAGKYLFADYGSGRIWTLTESGGSYTSNEVLDTSLSIGGFGQGVDGEVYVVPTVAAGGIYKFTESGGGSGSGEYDVADSLANTGCFQSGNPQLPTSGLVDYEPAASFWSDGATKERWVALPNSADISAQSSGEWVFPNGTVLAKHFRLQNQLIETRLMMRHPDGEWRGYTYEWNGGQTAATRVRNGKNRTVGSQTWTYPSESECLSCHTNVSNYALGLETAQLNSDHTYSSTGITDNQIETYNHIDMFTADLSEPVSGLPALADPEDNNASLTGRARAYLHTNCAQCHQPGGPTGTSLDVRYSTSLQNSGLCATPSEGNLGISNARIVAPGDSSRSVLVARMNTRNASAMPPLGSNVVDSAGVTLMSNWINSLTTCP